MSLLDEIAAATRRRVEQQKASPSVAVLESERRPHDFAAALRSHEFSVIAEIKTRSPSAGKIAAETVDPISVASAYLEAGAAAISVLTEPEYFGGDVETLKSIRNAFPDAVLLMKDFVVDDFQIHQAHHAGADAILLIVRLLDGDRLSRLLATCEALGLQALVEVHDEREVALAKSAGCNIIGVNNRDLDSLQVSLGTSERLAPSLPRTATLVSESGIETGEQLAFVQRLGFHAALVGTSLMRHDAPGEALSRLIRGAAACV